MTHAAVKEVTSAVFDGDGNIAIAPGARFPAAREFSTDVRWRWVVVPEDEAAQIAAQAEPPQAPVEAKAETASAKASARK